MIAGVSDFDEPVHVAKIAGVDMRFFLAPHDPLPYVALDDLFGAAGLALQHRAHARQVVLGLRASDVLDLTKEEIEMAKPFSVTTAAGDEIVVSQVAACGMVGSLISSGITAPNFASAYRAAVEAAVDHMHGGTAPKSLIEMIRTVAMAMYPFGDHPS